MSDQNETNLNSQKFNTPYRTCDAQYLFQMDYNHDEEIENRCKIIFTFRFITIFLT